VEPTSTAPGASTAPADEARASQPESSERPTAASALRSEVEREAPAPGTPTPRPFTPVTPPAASTQAAERAAEAAQTAQGVVPRFAAPMQETAEKTNEAETPSATRTSAPPASLRPNPPTQTAPRGTTEKPAVEPRTVASEETSKSAEAETTEGRDATARSAFPGGGAIVVRVSPISGFQGLMRVQDAIANLKEVREAAVEAYARGEAQLRVALTDELTPERLTRALTEGLGQNARVDAASVDERTMRVTLA